MLSIVCLARATVDELELRTWNHQKVRAFVQMPDAQTLLHGSRLRYTISIYKSGPPTLWDLIKADGTWQGELQAGHLWFREQLRGHGTGPQWTSVGPRPTHLVHHFT